MSAATIELDAARVSSDPCALPSCGGPIIYSGNGRPPAYCCPEHYAEAKRRRERDRRARAKARTPEPVELDRIDAEAAALAAELREEYPGGVTWRHLADEADPRAEAVVSVAEALAVEPVETERPDVLPPSELIDGRTYGGGTGGRSRDERERFALAALQDESGTGLNAPPDPRSWRGVNTAGMPPRATIERDAKRGHVIDSAEYFAALPDDGTRDEWARELRMADRFETTGAAPRPVTDPAADIVGDELRRMATGVSMTREDKAAELARRRAERGAAQRQRAVTNTYESLTLPIDLVLWRRWGFL